MAEWEANRYVDAHFLSPSPNSCPQWEGREPVPAFLGVGVLAPCVSARLVRMETACLPSQWPQWRRTKARGPGVCQHWFCSVCPSQCLAQLTFLLLGKKRHD